MPTLRAVVDVLGPALRPLTGDRGLDVEVDDVVVLGRGDRVPPAPGALLLCLAGLDPAETELTAAGLVVKLTGGDAGAAAARWAGAPLAVLAAADDLPWNHLVQLLSTAVLSSDAPGGGGAVGDLFALANAIAAMVGGAVAIEDPQRRVLAYSSLPDQPIDEARRQGILGRRVPALARNDALYRDLQRAPGVVRVPADGDVLGRLAVAVRSGPEVLGSVWVVAREPLGEQAERALLDAGRLTSLHLLRARAGRHVERRARGDLLRALLDGRSAPDLAATRLGLALTAPVAVLAFALPEPAAGDDSVTEAVGDLISLQCSTVHPRSAVLMQLGTAYALVPLSPDTRRERLTTLAREVVDRARAALAVELTAAVGSTVEGLAQLGRSRADADAALRLLPAGAVAAVEQVLPQVILLDLQAHLAAAQHLRLPAVTRLLAHDAEHGTPYAASVLAYLAANADVPAAAAAVAVHANTFRYRLRRVRELFGLDLEDPDVRLVAWLALRVRA